MIGLSPLSPGHRRTFQRTSVRPSTGSYPRFSLPRDSSPGFASAARDWSPHSDSLSLRLASQLNLAACQQLAGSFYKRHAVTPRGRSDALRAHGFRYCFTPLPGCFSPFPHGTGALSVTWEYSGLEGGPPGFGPGFTCPALLRCPPSGSVPGCAYGALTLCRRPSHAVRLPCTDPRRERQLPGGGPYNPGGGIGWRPPARRFGLGPLSLAATRGISQLISSPPGT